MVTRVDGNLCFTKVFLPEESRCATMVNPSHDPAASVLLIWTMFFQEEPVQGSEAGHDKHCSDHEGDHLLHFVTCECIPS